jgi:outer membrane protein assembly factor BamC
VAPDAEIAQLKREGSQRWLAVSVPPEKAYDVARAFWPSVGLALELEEPSLGIMETVWAENRAKLPQDVIRRTLGWALGSIYSTGEQDKFRTRIERTPKNTSEIFISHRGMIEVFTTSAQDSTKWQPRPSDPELEAEMLQRLLLRFRQPAQTTAATASPSAAAQATAAGAVTATVVADKAHLVKLADGGVERLAVDEPLDRAWRRVGLALDRGGFTVEDRDRTNGIYFVRFLDPEYEAKQREEQGLFSKLFGSDPKIEAPQFRVKLTEGGAGTDVTVLTSDGKPEASGTGNKILSLLYEQLR